MLPARLRSGASWSDACILNISSRGLLVHSIRTGPEGSLIELRRGEHVIRARVVWRDGARAGLQSEERLPVEAIMSQGAAPTLQITAGDTLVLDRRRQPRAPSRDSRLRGRAFEFASAVLIGATLAAGAFSMVEQALSRPLGAVSAALGG